MRLLHTKLLEFEEFYDDDSEDVTIPKYAIVSHRWGPDEVTYHELLLLAVDSAFSDRRVPWETERKRKGQGYRKILAACDLAASQHYDWIWTDTCCIDKTSSAELTEAINSMWSWYFNSAVCLAYLPDVNSHSPNDLSVFEKSAWFTRGWTLQELLAPKQVLFYANDWTFIGHKATLAASISKLTGIDSDCILVRNSVFHKSVHARMLWAANRRTTRVEDQAYCLMGLFRVNMPLLYGEGRKAFQRLQQEIMTVWDDESIFAHSHHHKRVFLRPGLLTSSSKDL